MSKLAFLFPGQGAQKTGMGKDFYDNYQTARKIFDDAGQWLNLDMEKLIFEKNEKLDSTQYTQAALVVTCLAMEKVLEEQGVCPDVTAGLSLGEYCAIQTAGGLSLKDAVTTVRKRGILMEEAYPAGQGSMAAVLGLSADRVDGILQNEPGVSIANYNCPGQIVITGVKREVEKVSAKLREAGARRVLPLNVSGPFHSPMMEEAGIKLKLVLDQIHLHSLAIPYVTNVTAQYVTDEEEITDLLSRQISSSVLWQQSIEKMTANGVDTFVEIGPGKTLTGFMRKINRDVKMYHIQNVEEMEQTVAKLKSGGSDD